MQIDLAERLAALQAEMAETDEGMGNKLGVGRTRWTNWRNLENMPEEAVMIELCDIGKVSMDWLYRGKADALALGHAIRLTARLLGENPDEATSEVLTRYRPGD